MWWCRGSLGCGLAEGDIDCRSLVGYSKFPVLIGIFVGAARVVRQLTYHVTSRRFGDQSAPLDAIGRLLAS